MDPLKIVIVGESLSGKTNLWQSYFQNRRPSEYTQTIFDNHSTSVAFGGKEIPINIFELCGDEDYASLRKVVYPGTSIVILCIATDNPEISEKKRGKHSRLDLWAQELRDCCKGVPVLLVCTKRDLKEDPALIYTLAEQKMKPLKLKDIVHFSKKFKNSQTAECSSLSRDGLNNVFQTAVKLGLRHVSSTNGNK